MNQQVRVWAVVLTTALGLATATPALAFDTGPHQEITESALTAEGFGKDATGVAQVNNWFTDLYHELSSHKMPASGHADIFKRLAVTEAFTEGWPDNVVAAATRLHFDNWPGVPAEAARPDLGTTAGIENEWNRLRSAVYTLVQEARDHNDPEELLAVLGISLHPLQDFYSHTDWVEPLADHGLRGVDGPGWHERGFGSYPTWFDIPKADRDAATIYGDNTPGHPRWHGLWNADNNESMVDGVNKDWPGRPYYLPAAITAYFASRQWIEAVRSWVNDDVFWTRAQHFHASQPELDHDLEGRYRIMLQAGHWQGQGEPLGGDAHGLGGSLLDLRSAVRDYFLWPVDQTADEGRGREPQRHHQDSPASSPGYRKTVYRARFEQLVKRVAEPNPIGQLGPVPSSQDLQHSMRIVVLRITKLHSEGLGDPGLPDVHIDEGGLGDGADMYANVAINGQQMTSAIIHGENDFSFPNPYEPFTWFKAVPAGTESSEPVESIEATIRTANVRWAGTNDDVYLRLGPNLRFKLDKSWHDDFERGDSDTYSVPIDDAVRNGLNVGDIREVALEKSRDGIAGGWKVGGMEVFVNGREIYDNQHIDRWLEDDRRKWVAPDFTPSDPRSQKIPIWLNLRESDSLYGGDDEGDINPYDARDTVSLGYAPGAPLTATTKGGKKLEGRRGIGGDEASINYRLETLTPEPMQEIGAPGVPRREPEPLPDLTITEYTASGEITVLNKGFGAAGPFRLKAGNRTVNFDGLPAGASFKVSLPDISCAGEECQAIVDDLEQVVESDETNNTKERGTVIF